MGVSGEFIDGSGGRILLVCHEPAGAFSQAVIVFPPLGEEMNKARRLIWSLGQALAARGVMTVIPDLSGTGDSEGAFDDSTWDGWCEDMATTIRWARERGAQVCDALLIRLGACLYPSCASLLGGDKPHRVAAWQPEHSGSVALRQLLRLKVMSDRITWGESTTLAQLRERLDSEPVEIGGYTFSPALARALETAAFDWAHLPGSAHGAFFDWGRPAANASKSESIDDAAKVQRIQAEGQRFWTAVEPLANPQLIDETVSFLAVVA